MTNSRPKRDRRAPRRRMSAGDRRGLILAQAKRLFASRGYAATSLDEVAAAAGVTKPVVYDHFASKHALYCELMRLLRDELVASAATALSEPADPPARFRAAIRHFFEQVHRDPAIVELLFVQPRTSPDLAQEWQKLQREALAQLRPLTRSLAPNLAPWKLDVALHLVHHGLNAATSVWPRRASVDDMSALVASLLWKGLDSLR